MLIIEFPSRDVLNLIYYYLDKNKFIENLKNVDLILLKSDYGESYLYRIIKGKTLNFKLRDTCVENKLNFGKKILRNKNYYINSYKEKIYEFLLTTPTDKIYTNKQRKLYEKENSFFCMQKMFEYYNFSALQDKNNTSQFNQTFFNDKQLLSIYYFEKVVDFELNFSKDKIIIDFPDIILNYNYSISGKDGSLNDENFVTELNNSAKIINILDITGNA